MRQNLENIYFCTVSYKIQCRIMDPFGFCCWLLNVFGLYCLKLLSDWKLNIILILQITNTEEIKLCLHEANARAEMVM